MYKTRELVFIILLTILAGIGIGFIAGRNYEKQQHDTINIKVPGFQYHQ